MDKTPTIAGVVLTLNEEKDLARALSSLSWCDELLVVDSGSTDGTQAVARQFHARFVSHIQPAPFLITEQRNWALSSGLLESEWVLFLDADEEVGSALKQSIVNILSISDGTHSYYLTPRYWFFGKWLRRTQNYPNWHPRLVKRGFVSFTGGVWESFSDPSSSGIILEPYEHYPFSKGLDPWISSHLRYASEEANTIYHFIKSNHIDERRIQRRRYKRLLAIYLWPLRPILKFFDKYLVSFAFIEGWQSLLYSLLMFAYELMVIVKVLERLAQPSKHKNDQ